MLRVGGARAEREARDLRVLGAAARRGGHGAVARLHQPRVLPKAPGAVAFPARVRALGGVDRVLRADGVAPRPGHAQQARERGGDAAGQDRVHHGDHQPARVRAQDAEPVGRGPGVRHLVRRHPAVPVQDQLQHVGRAAHQRRQHRAQDDPRHAVVVMPVASVISPKLAVYLNILLTVTSQVRIIN